MAALYRFVVTVECTTHCVHENSCLKNHECAKVQYNAQDAKFYSHEDLM